MGTSNRTLLFSIFAMTSLIFLPSNARASCGSANCFLVTGTQEGVFSPGQVVLDLSFRYLSQDRKLKGSSTTDEVLVPKVDFTNRDLELNHHRELRTINTLAQLDVNVGITSRLTAALALPFFNDRLHEHDDGVDLTAIPPMNGVFTNDDSTSGFGDLALTGKYAIYQSTRHLVIAGLGIKFPTGEYELRDNEGGINEPTLMPGTGSFDYLLSMMYSYQWQPHKLGTFLALLYRINTENDLDYQFGNSTVLNAGLTYQLTSRIGLSGQLNARFAERDEFIGADVPSTGSTMVYLTPGIRLQSSDNTEFYVHVQLPVYQEVNEVNLAPNYGLQLGLSHSL